MLKQALADLGPLSPSAALVVVFVLIVTGKLVPAWTLRQLEEARDRHIDELKAANVSQAQTIEQQADTIRDLLEGARLSIDVASAIKSSGGA